MSLDVTSHDSADSTDSLVAIGRILRPFGIRGEVRVEPLSDVPERFQRLELLRDVRLVTPSGKVVVTSVTRAWAHGGGYVLAFEGLSTPEQAAVFRGGFIKIPMDRVPALPPDQYYQFELIGLTVLDQTGRTLGKLGEVLETGSNAVFVVHGPEGETLLPATRHVVTRVDLRQRTMTVRTVDVVGDHDAV